MSDQLVKAVRTGSLAEVQSLLRGSNVMCNRLNKAGQTVLHAAVWRSRLAVIELLLQAGALTDVQDAESGWTALHCALFYGNLQAASLLLQAGASPVAGSDHKGRYPLDLLSSQLAATRTSAASAAALDSPAAAVAGISVPTGLLEEEQGAVAEASPPVHEVFSWGHGANYQLGTGATGAQVFPGRLDGLHGSAVRSLAAAKFHSAALTEAGDLYTWGYGRGGRLGQPEFNAHSGESAVIAPQLVVSLRARVLQVTLAKHHSLAVCQGGELYSWGSNRDGRLGYLGPDSQPTPRRVSGLKGVNVVTAAAANRHTVVAASDGRVFSWGSNLQGQLGYGTSDSASNATPRLVEAMKGKRVVAVAAAKRHSVVLTSSGEILTWGHRVVTPRRVVLAGARDTERLPCADGASNGPIEFHKGQAQVARPVPVAICAGAAHSCALTAPGDGGVLLAWHSMDPHLRAQEVGGALLGQTVVAASAGKYRTAAVTAQGDVYMWEGWSKALPSGASPSPQGVSLGSLGGSTGGSLGGGFTAVRQSRASRSSEGAEVSNGRSGSLSKKAVIAASTEILPQRVEGLKGAVGVAVGEKHSLAMQAWHQGPLLDVTWAGESADDWPAFSPAGFLDQEELQPWQLDSSHSPSAAPKAQQPGRGVSSLQELCEQNVAKRLLEPRTCLQLLEFADAAGARMLFRACMTVAVRNLDIVLLEAGAALPELPQHLAASLEAHLKLYLPVHASAAPASAEDGEDAFVLSTAPAAQAGKEGPLLSRPSGERSFKATLEAEEEASLARLVRMLRKKLQQVQALEERHASGQGQALDVQQMAKLSLRPYLEAALEAAEAGATCAEVQARLREAEAQEALSSSQGPASKARKEAKRRSRKSSTSLSELPPSAPDAIPVSEDPNWLDPWDDLLTATPAAPSAAAASSAADSAPQLPPSALRAALADADVRQNFWRRQPEGREESEDAEGWPSMSTPQEPSSTSEAGPSKARPEAGRSSADRAPRKLTGGLSMFLKGGLDSVPKPSTPVPAAQPAPSPWKSSVPAASLLHIQSQQGAAATVLGETPASAAAAAAPAASPAPKGPQSRAAAAESEQRYSLSAFMRKSSPIAVARQPAQEQPASRPEDARPAWSARAPPLGSSPLGRGLMDIQAEQEQARETMSRSFGGLGASPSSGGGLMASKSPPWHGAGMKPTAMTSMGSSPGIKYPAGTSPGTLRRIQGFAPSNQPQSKWYLQDPAIAGSISRIQTEENVAKEQAAAEEAARLAAIEAKKAGRLAAQAAKKAAKEAAQREAAEKAALQALQPQLPAEAPTPGSEAASKPAKPRRHRRRPDAAAQGAPAGADQPAGQASARPSVPEESAEPAQALLPSQFAPLPSPGKTPGRRAGGRQGSGRQQASQAESGQGQGRQPHGQADVVQGSGRRRSGGQPTGPARQHEPHISQDPSFSSQQGRRSESGQHQRGPVPRSRTASASEAQLSSPQLPAQLSALSLGGQASSSRASEHGERPRYRGHNGPRCSHAEGNGLLQSAVPLSQPQAADGQ